MKTGIFGGTFDPAHNGHLAMAQAILDFGHAEKIVFVPAWEPPHKTAAAVTQYRHRFNMLELAVRGRPGFAVSDVESKRGGRSYTIDTLELLSSENQTDEIMLIAGEDSLRNLHTWRRADELIAKFKLLICRRPGENVSRAELEKQWTPEVADKLLAEILDDVPMRDVSSTGIRKLIAEGDRAAASKYLPESVFNYILAHRLYEKQICKAGGK